MVNEIIVSIQSEMYDKFDKSVRVVRCKDCVSWDTDWKPTRAIEGAYWCSYNDIIMGPDDYCSNGERKK